LYKHIYVPERMQKDLSLIEDFMEELNQNYTTKFWGGLGAVIVGLAISALNNETVKGQAKISILNGKPN